MYVAAGHMSANFFEKSLNKAVALQTGEFKVKSLSSRPIQRELRDPALRQHYLGTL